MKPRLVGEAPSAQGDGRPFTGPSGDRLQQLLGLESYDELESKFNMLNLFEVPSPIWDRFDREYATKKATRLTAQWTGDDGLVDVILAGRKVMRAFRLDHLPWFHFDIRGNIVFWAFPHPSGLNHFWNDSENVREASQFLMARAVGSRTDHPSEHSPLDQHAPQARLK